MAVRQPERDVRCAARRVDAELLPEASHQGEDLTSRRPHRADRHDERIDHDVLVADPMVGGPFDDLLRDREAHVGLLADAGLVVRDRDDRGAVLRDERQHRFEPLVLTRDRVHERFAPVGGKPGLQRRDDRGVDGQRHVGQRLHEPHRLGEDGRLVGQWDAGVHVQHLRAGLDLRQGVGDDGREVPGCHLVGELLSPGRVDPFADDHERTLEPDRDLLRGRAHHRVGHAGSLPR